MPFQTTYNNVLDSLLGNGQTDAPWAQQARNQGLLDMGLSLLATSGRNMPAHSFNQNLAQGLLAGREGYAAVPQAIQAQQAAAQKAALDALNAQSTATTANARALTARTAAQQAANPYRYDNTTGVFYNVNDPRAPGIPLMVPNPAAAAPVSGGLLAAAPKETQDYTRKIFGLLGDQPAFDQFGQPTAGLLDAQRQVESGGNPLAVSPKGAQGPYQFMPATAAQYGLADPFDPQAARAAAARLDADNFKRFGDPRLAVAAYNMGPGATLQIMQQAQQRQTQQPAAAAGADLIPVSQLKQQEKAASGGLFGAEGNFTPDAQQLLTAAGEQGFQLPIPSVGMGGNARVQYVNGMAADLAKRHIPFDLAVQEMRFGATANTGIKKSQDLYSATKTLEAGADALADQASQLASTVDRGNVPLFNAWVNAGRRATGDPKIAKFDRAINAFVNDYAKVVSGSLGSAGSSDAARKQAEDQLTAAQSPAQFAASIQQMQTEMHARTGAMLQSIRDQVGAIANGGVAAGPARFGNAPQPAAASAPPAAAVAYLKAHPDLATQFDAKYGAGAAKAALGN